MKNPPKKRTNSRVNNLTREIAHAQKRYPLSDLDEILHDGRYPRRNHVGKFWWRSVKGFRCGGGQILAFPIDFDRRPYNTLGLPCEFVIFVPSEDRDVNFGWCVNHSTSWPTHDKITPERGVVSDGWLILKLGASNQSYIWNDWSKSHHILTPDTTLVRYMLSPCVRLSPSVHHKYVGCLNC